MRLDPKLLQPGKLVSLRDRDWVVLPSEDPDVLLIRPLGGSDDETTGIYLPLGIESEMPKEARFPLPTAKDVGDIRTARLLYDAARLGFRNAAGPFRAFAKLSFRPRAYQVVPLVMALKQEVVRLLIADDVGVGKTVEALLIVREMLERRKIKRFAVLCPPHLCDQWSEEIKAKLGMEATVMRASTKARLDRGLPGDVSPYDYYPYQITSIDFIKSDTRRNVYAKQCPELVIVDEAHACARPFGVSDSHQQRYFLLNKIAQKPTQHLVLLTATPHSGKSEEFLSLLGLLNKEYDDPSWIGGDPEKLQKLSEHVVQRKRQNIIKWMGEDTRFPERESNERTYKLSKSYAKLLDDILEFSRKVVVESGKEKKGSVHHWAALGLLRGVMSSPRAGKQMLDAKLGKSSDSLLDEVEFAHQPTIPNPIGDAEGGVADTVPSHVIEKVKWSASQRARLRDFSCRIEKLENLAQDQKLGEAAAVLSDWLSDGYKPVVFCRYINTAKYVQEILDPHLKKAHPNLETCAVTSEEPDDRRKELINELAACDTRLLIATDCLSEGINLQEQFDSVLHYDLPWNPNRLEQREGRVDRFGQSSPVVRVCLLRGIQNPIDNIVLEVLLRKIREIKDATGISVPFPADSQSVIDAITISMLLKPDRSVATIEGEQAVLFDISDFGEAAVAKDELSEQIEEAARREKNTQSRFSQSAIRSDEIESDLKEVDEAIGDPTVTEAFVVGALPIIFNSQVVAEEHGYTIVTTNLGDLVYTLPGKGEKRRVSFKSPTPNGYHYIGRNHSFIERICHKVIASAMDSAHEGRKMVRAAVVCTNAVTEKTTIMMLRCRNLIKQNFGEKQIIAEEMVLHGCVGGKGGKVLSHDDSKRLLYEAKPVMDLSHGQILAVFENEIAQFEGRREEITYLAERQSRNFARAHTRFSKLMNHSQFQVVHPVLPPDLLGMYILTPGGKT